MQFIEHACSVYFGCDPELFFRHNGMVISSEKVIPKDGIKTGKGKIVRDGMLVEIHPNPSACRESLAYNIAECIKSLSSYAANKASLSFDGTVKLSKKELSRMSKESKVLGCSPSLSAYGDAKIKVDGQKCKSRSAGGHIHLSVYGDSNKSPLKHPEIVPLLDLLLGNTLVLIDKNPDNAIRRKIYGRAGEHRRPTYPNGLIGLEYRTPSNIWLRHYSLMSLVMSLARFTVNIIYNDIVDWGTHAELGCCNNMPKKYNQLKNMDFHKALLDTVDQRAVIAAINQNDYDLAMQNFVSMLDVLLEIVNPKDNYAPFNSKNIHLFMLFIETGLDHWFSRDVVSNWHRYTNEYSNGWERFRDITLKRAVEKEIKKLAAISSTSEN